MIDHTALHLAFRTRLATLSVATTGSTTLSATTTGYARAAGSFITDGFREGMEVLPSGFTNAANNEYGIVTRVEALALTIRGGRLTESAASGKTITAGLPEGLADENVEFVPVKDRPYVEENYVRGPRRMISFPYQNGAMQEDGFYTINWYFLPQYDVMAAHDCVDAVLALFAPGTTLTTGSNTAMVSGDPGPEASQLEPDADGYAVVSVSIPFFAFSTNTIAA